MRDIKIYAVKDELTNTFLQPTFHENDLEITRLFEFQINNTPLWKDNASDYSLYKLGKFNEETGEIISKIEKLTGGRACVRKEEK